MAKKYRFVGDEELTEVQAAAYQTRKAARAISNKYMDKLKGDLRLIAIYSGRIGEEGVRPCGYLFRKSERNGETVGLRFTPDPERILAVEFASVASRDNLQLESDGWAAVWEQVGGFLEKVGIKKPERSIYFYEMVQAFEMAGYDTALMLGL